MVWVWRCWQVQVNILVGKIVQIICNMTSYYLAMLLSDQIYVHIPRKVINWSCKDIKKWFFIHDIIVDDDHPLWTQAMNGAAFLKFTPRVLFDDLRIHSAMMVKKIMEWITLERSDFDEYVSEKGECSEAASVCQADPRNIFSGDSEREIAQHRQLMKGSEEQNGLESEIRAGSSRVIYPLHSQNKPSRLATSHYMGVGPYLVVSYNNISIGVNNSCTIGRSPHIHFIEINHDVSVSRSHAEIVKDNEVYYLKDSQSRFGTFIEIGAEKRPLQEGDTLNFDGEQVQIHKIGFSKGKKTFNLQIKRENGSTNVFAAKSIVTIGSKPPKDIVLLQRQGMRNHAVITIQNGVVCVMRREGDVYVKMKPHVCWRLDKPETKVMFGLVCVTISLTEGDTTVKTNDQ